MDQLSPEIIHIVVSFMELKDRLQFRLVNKNFAFIGRAHVLEEICMSIHSRHLAKMRAVAEESHLARNVRHLIYESRCLNPHPSSFKSYASEYDMWQQLQRLHPDDKHFQLKPTFSAEQLQQSYQRYLDETKAQASSWARHADYACLAQVMPSFCNLRKVTMSCDNHFNSHRRGTSSVYDDDAHIADYDYDPEGARQFEALLDALGLHEMKIAELQAGMMDWRFFDKEPERLEQLYEPLASLTSIDLVLTVATDDEGGASESETAECRDVLKKGQIGDLFKSSPSLQLLNFSIQGDLFELQPAASLHWVIPSGHVWPNLREVLLEGIDCSRAAVWSFLELHKDTLVDFAFGEVVLNGSWEKFLADIRSKLYLHDVLIYGRIVGHSEDSRRLLEEWDLVMPEVGPSDMRSSISLYCELGGKNYPDELPLSDDVVRKYFESHVRAPGMVSEEEDAERMRVAEREFREEHGDALGRIYRRARRRESDDSESADSGWDDPYDHDTNEEGPFEDDPDDDDPDDDDPDDDDPDDDDPDDDDPDDDDLDDDDLGDDDLDDDDLG
ncbi:hypothetical protein KJ359_003649 [Pestalotiopsis sp. 9143b]|nr:hypothetical protein KJ359_003649 [Pestalotiopsis sp. 9143b]